MTDCICWNDVFGVGEAPRRGTLSVDDHNNYIPLADIRLTKDLLYLHTCTHIQYRQTPVREKEKRIETNLPSES